MKIPKYIDKALKRRSKLAWDLISACATIDDWLLTNGIEPDESCWATGVEIYGNPDIAEHEVRRAIAVSQKGKKNNERNNL